MQPIMININKTQLDDLEKQLDRIIEKASKCNNLLASMQPDANSIATEISMGIEDAMIAAAEGAE